MLGGQRRRKGRLLADNRPSSRFPHSGLLPAAPHRALGPGERRRGWGGGPALPRPGSSPFPPGLPGLLAAVSPRRRKPAEGRACRPVGVSAACLGAPGRAGVRSPPLRSSRNPAAAPPGLPARSHRPLDSRGQFARKPVASICRSGLRQGRRARLGGVGARSRPGPPRAPQGGRAPGGGCWPFPDIYVRAHASRGRWRARASGPRAPGSIFSPH